MAKIKLKSLIESLVRKTLQENYSAEQNIRDLIDYAGDDTKMLRAIESILKNTKMQDLYFRIKKRTFINLLILLTKSKFIKNP